MAIRTQGKWVVIESKDVSCDKPYYEYRIIAYPYGIKAGAQRVCDCMSKFDAEYICKCVNENTENDE